MTVATDLHDDCIAALYEHALGFLPDAVEWFDAHTHTGQNDPDGRSAVAQDIVETLDRAGHHRALLFSLHEPHGYREANDRVLAEARDSGGRLVALGRVSPDDGDPVAEARRCLDAGAAGIKLHPRSDAFTMAHPAIAEVVELCGERGAIVLIHSGRGIPSLGSDTLVLARRHPRARFVLAHGGITDLAWIWRQLGDVPNLFFDTSWWNVADLRALFANVPPGHLLYGSDAPYGAGRLSGLITLRCAAAAGLGPEALRSVVGGQLARLVAGEEPADAGPAPGWRGLDGGPSVERAVSWSAAGCLIAFVGVRQAEVLNLARASCEVDPGDPAAPHLGEVMRLLDVAVQALGAEPYALEGVTCAAIAAHIVAGTPEAGVPG